MKDLRDKVLSLSDIDIQVEKSMLAEESSIKKINAEESKKALPNNKQEGIQKGKENIQQN